MNGLFFCFPDTEVRRLVNRIIRIFSNEMTIVTIQ